MARRRRPWYSFLYVLLGAQGSFFAWIGALAGIYFTFEPALLYVLNRPGPREALVHEVISEDFGFRRWVRVSGLEVDLSTALDRLRGPEDGSSGGGGAGTGPPAPAPGGAGRAELTVLLDPADPAAGAFADLARELASVPKAGTVPNEALDPHLRRAQGILLEAKVSRFVPRTALVLVLPEAARAGAGGTGGGGVGAGTGGAGAPGTAKPPSEALAVFRRETLARVEALRAAIRPSSTREGILEAISGDEAMRSLAERLGAGAAESVKLGPFAFEVDERPSRTLAALFVGFVIVLLFLLIGLRGLREPGETPPSQKGPP